MSSDRKSAIWIGMLYIVASVFLAMSAAPLGALIDGRGILVNVAAHEGQLITVALLMLASAVAVPGIAFMFYPILMRVADTGVKQGLVFWYVGTRITEGAIYVVGVLSTLAFLPLSREFAAVGAPKASHFQTSSIVIQSTTNLAFSLAQVVFAIGAMMMYYLLLQSKLVPRWLSLWGLVAAPLLLVGSLSLLWTGDPNSTLSSLLYAPLGLQEVVLAVWLIVKGFDPAALASGSALTKVA